MTTLNNILNQVIEHSRLLDVDEDLAIQEYYKVYSRLKVSESDEKAIEDSMLATKRWITAYSKKQDERYSNDI